MDQSLKNRPLKLYGDNNKVFFVTKIRISSASSAKVPKLAQSHWSTYRVSCRAPLLKRKQTNARASLNCKSDLAVLTMTKSSLSRCPEAQNRVYLRKTRLGNVSKSVREHYVRTDLSTGLGNGTSFGNKRIDLPVVPNANVAAPKHFLIASSDVLVQQMDVLETLIKQNVVAVVVPISSARVLARRSPPLMARLIEMVREKSLNVNVFLDEYHKETCVDRVPGMTDDHVYCQAMRNVVNFFRASSDVEHWPVFITDKTGTEEDVDMEGGESHSCSLSMNTYIEGLDESIKRLVVDKLKFASDEERSESSKFFYDEHWTPERINAGIKDGSLIQGSLHVNRSNFREAEVRVQDDIVLIQGLKAINRAVDGDLVAIKVLPKEEWTAPSEVVVDEDDEDEEEKEEERKEGSASKMATGVVVGVIRRHWRQYCGMLKQNELKGGSRHLFVPAERRVPKIRIETRQAENLMGQRIVVAIDQWPRNSRYPLGHFVRSLGPIGDKETENEVLLLEHDVPHSNFSEAVLACLPTMPWTIDEGSVTQNVRQDLRNLAICSVDPPGCTDIDDALHCRLLSKDELVQVGHDLHGDKIVEVGVHIADVSHFIKAGTELDKEASNRGTTVYLTDRRIDMVPELLSSNLCSLRGNEERYAFSVLFTMNLDKAEILSKKFCKSIIKSKASLTYEQAQNIIDDKKDESDVAKSLRMLLKLSKIMKERRLERGALLLASSEVRFDLDTATKDPTEVRTKVVRDTNSMVEEFMLAANVAAAQTIFEEFSECAMLRRHPSPTPSNFDPLIKAARQRGFEIRVDSSKALAESLDEAKDEKEPFFNTMLRMIATRCMMQALYFASGTEPESNFSHYGLACPIYTHFTSPIRRYADIIVHRLLAASIDAEPLHPDLLDKLKTQRVAEHINYRHRMAQYAGRASVNLHTHIFFKQRKGQVEKAFIMAVKMNGIQVMIPKYGLEGTIFVDDKNCEGVAFVYDPEVPSQTCGQFTLKLFQNVSVMLTVDESNVQHEKLVLKLVKPFISGFSVECKDESEAQDEEVARNEGKPTPKSKKKARKGRK